ncbi:hypothetical protein BDQ17DRAFT_1408786 [Cyathus striatus]|nr:hypothetical protein BDQ17DRAFT_1408786 [Cyathus striatus]
MQEGEVEERVAVVRDSGTTEWRLAVITAPRQESVVTFSSDVEPADSLYMSKNPSNATIPSDASNVATVMEGVGHELGNTTRNMELCDCDIRIVRERNLDESGLCRINGAEEDYELTQAASDSRAARLQKLRKTLLKIANIILQMVRKAI